MSWLVPREHGAYGQLGVPLVVALVASPLNPDAALIAAGATLAFFAYEPLLVKLGRRGRRRQTELARPATRSLILRGSAAVALGGFGLVQAALPVAAWGGVVGAVLVTFIFLALRQERTVWGECAAAVALSGAATPVAVANGVDLLTAYVEWAAWVVGFATSTFVVHAVIERSKKRSERASWGAIAIGLAILGVAAAVGSPVAAAAPLVLASAVVRWLSPHARHLRKLGFTLLGASVATGIGLWLMRSPAISG